MHERALLCQVARVNHGTWGQRCADRSHCAAVVVEEEVVREELGCGDRGRLATLATLASQGRGILIGDRRHTGLASLLRWHLSRELVKI